VDLARRVGSALAPYDLVITSEIARAIETAIAMGYAIDRSVTMLGSVMLADREVDWTPGWSALADAAQLGGTAHFASQSHAILLRSIAAEIPEDGRALVVSHGGVVELGVVGLLPDYDFSDWGGLCERCEGVRLSFEGPDCTGAELLRLEHLVPAS
jgi:broad specificity phosphatase PhoE